MADPVGNKRPGPRPASNGVMEAVNGVIYLMEQIPMSLILLLARIGVGMVFLVSAKTKVVDWALIDAVTFNLTLADNTFVLFEYEYALPILPFELAAYLATYAESLLPLLLFIGLFTRLAALVLFGMTMVIQIFVYPGHWSEHAFWAAALLLVMARGPGMVSLEHWLGKVLGGRS
jgi:putative oxidoreductase